MLHLKTGETVLLSEDDLDLAALRWHRQKGRRTSYAVRNERDLKKKTIYLHRVVMGRMLNRPLQRSELVHHVNDNGLDNRRENLELVTTSQNLGYAWEKRDRKTGYPGVVYDKNPTVKTRPYRAMTRIRGRQVALGRYPTAEEAYEIVSIVRNALGKENIYAK